MNLSREQMLAEMGITPIWRLRESGEAVPADQAPDTLPAVEGSAPAGVVSSAAPVAVNIRRMPETISAARSRISRSSHDK